MFGNQRSRFYGESIRKDVAIFLNNFPQECINPI